MTTVDTATATATRPNCQASGPASVWAASGPTGADVLAVASHFLPWVSVGGPFSGDVHAALFGALEALGVGGDRYHRLRLADEARDMLAAYLMTARHAVCEARVSDTMRGWVIFQDLTEVRRTMVDAAGHWRRLLDPQLGPLSGERDG
jgi:hypothetical protein